jgi:hypothetical protein
VNNYKKKTKSKGVANNAPREPGGVRTTMQPLGLHVKMIAIQCVYAYCVLAVYTDIVRVYALVPHSMIVLY